MIDALIQPIQSRILLRPAIMLARRGVSADTITLTGFVLGLMAVLAVALGAPLLALMLLAANRIADGLDGAVARVNGPTARGAFLDIALDFAFYGLFPLGFAFADPTTNALPAAVLVAAFIGTGSSFLAYASVAAANGARAASFPTKGIYYLDGLTEGAETIAVFTLMCLWPPFFPVLAYIFAVACALTTLSRWHQGWTAFSSASKSQHGRTEDPHRKAHR